MKDKMMNKLYIRQTSENITDWNLRKNDYVKNSNQEVAPAGFEIRMYKPQARYFIAQGFEVSFKLPYIKSF